MDPKSSSSRHGVLERILIDVNAEPTNLSLSLLEDITNHFSPDYQIGRGGFAVVYKGIVGERMVAVKKLFQTFDIMHQNKFHKEVECLMKAKHTNIVRFLGYCAEERGKAAADCEGKFVMANLLNWLLCFEYVPNGNLKKYITDASGGLEWRMRFRIIKGICEGLHYLHMNRILHLDLKPANILIDSHMVPKIADFGLSRCLNEEKTQYTTNHLSGTPGYMAPEIFGGKITFASDIYSLGIIIMEMITGVKGYPEDDNVIESWISRLDGDTELEQVRQCTKIGIECMESDPKRRPLAQSIIDMLDKMAGADETGSSSLVEMEIGSLIEQSGRGGVGDQRLTDIGECPVTEDVEERPVSEFSQQREENTEDEQDTERKVKREGKGVSSSTSGVLEKLKFWNTFKRDTRKDFVVPKIRGLTIFTMRELKKITRNYSDKIGEGGFAVVYRGTLPDNTTVAVKYFKEHYRNGWFVDTVEIQTEMIHKNILKLVGYCLKGDVQISVHEDYYASLHDILHHKDNPVLPIDLRLDIAIGSAEGLRYMHSGGIRHGDVKPMNIQFVEQYTPKVSEFELSKLINVDSADTGEIFGTPFYIDPVYAETAWLTLRGDVYGFGAILLELITGKRFVCFNDDEPSTLAIDYKKCYEKEKTGRALFDENIVAAEDMFVLEEIGKLAMECLRVDKEELRPDMMEVTNRLVMIRRDRKARLES